MMGRGEGEKRKEGFSPSALSLFRFHLSSFPPETPDTQATRTPESAPDTCWYPRVHWKLSCARNSMQCSKRDKMADEWKGLSTIRPWRWLFFLQRHFWTLLVQCSEQWKRKFIYFLHLCFFGPVDWKTWRVLSSLWRSSRSLNYFLFSNDDTMAKGKISSSSGESMAIESTVKRVTESER